MKTPLTRPRNFRPTGKAGNWYSIKNLSADEAEVFIYDEIGYYGVSAADFAAELQGVSAQSILLRISSPGGDVFDGLAILNSLRQHKATVNVVIDGIAASAASFIAMAGDTVKMSPQSMMMIHDASGLCIGNGQDMQEMSDLLDKTSDNIAAIYAQRAGGTPEDWRATMRAETWYTDQEAVQAGLADEVVGSEAEADDHPKNSTTDAPRAETPEWGFDIAALVKEAIA
jgi:ATP-dependent protease ClpP protease subunit